MYILFTIKMESDSDYDDLLINHAKAYIYKKKEKNLQEMVGIISVDAIGEPLTSMNLMSFHKNTGNFEVLCMSEISVTIYWIYE
jgi:hypothetical protein